ncbi:MAG: hypothetical protein U0641_05655 [Anaerolineae bacterium]
MREAFTVGANLLMEVVNVETGEVERQEVHNLVVDAGLNLLKNALYGSAPDLYLNRMRIGTNGTATNGGMTSILASVATYTPTSRAADDGAKKVTVKLFVPTGDLNGQTLREIGLYTNNTDTLFSRAVFNQIAKTQQINITFTWDVYFSAVEG